MSNTTVDKVQEDISSDFILISGQIYYDNNNNNHRYMAAGDVKSLLTVALTLQRIFKIKKINHRFSNAVIPDQDLTDNNIISVGGPKYNSITKALLAKYDELDDFPIEFNNNNIIVSRFQDGKRNINELRYQKINDIVIQDYGVIIKSKNLFNSSKSVWILAGSGNNGVWAAAEYFSENLSEQTLTNQHEIEIFFLKVNLFEGEYVSSTLIFHTSQSKNTWNCDLDDLKTNNFSDDFPIQEKNDVIKTEKLSINLDIDYVRVLNEIANQYGLSKEHFIEKLVKSEINHYQRHLF